MMWRESHSAESTAAQTTAYHCLIMIISGGDGL